MITTCNATLWWLYFSFQLNERDISCIINNEANSENNKKKKVNKSTAKLNIQFVSQQINENSRPVTKQRRAIGNFLLEEAIM